MAKKFFYVKVNMDVYYCIEEGTNGWDHDGIIEEWFKNFPLSQSHASRDHSKIGGSEIIKDIRVITEKELWGGRMKLQNKKEAYCEHCSGIKIIEENESVPRVCPFCGTDNFGKRHYQGIYKKEA